MIKRIIPILFLGFTATAHADLRGMSPFVLMNTTNEWTAGQYMSWIDVSSCTGCGGGSDNMGSHLATNTVQAPFGIIGSSAVFVSSVTAWGGFTSTTGFIGHSSTFNYVQVGSITAFNVFFGTGNGTAGGFDDPTGAKPLQIEMIADGIPNVTAGIQSTWYFDSGNTRLTFRAARNSRAAPATVVNNTRLYVMNGDGYDGTKFVRAAQIRSDVTGSVSVGTVPAKLEFLTRDSSGVFKVNLTILPSGQALFFDRISSSNTINTSSGITSPSSTMTYINVSTLTVGRNATSVFTSSWAARAFDGFVMYYATGSIAANVTLTLTASQFSGTEIAAPNCSELEGVNTASNSVRLKSLANLPTSFDVYNGDITNMKNYACYFWVKPN